MAKQSAAGINLSAFGVEKRPMLALAQDEGEGVISVKLSEAGAFGGKVKQMDALDDLFARWRPFLLDLPRPIAVDVPVGRWLVAGGQWFEKASNQPPATNHQPRYVWQLTHRPIDFAFYGDAPLTDRVGTFNVRFAELLARSQFKIGADIIEACPAACVEFFDFRGSYKGGRAHQGKKGWKPDDSNQSADRAFCKIVEQIGFNIENTAEGKFDSGDFDAVMCALIALTRLQGKHTVTGKEFAQVIAERVARRMTLEPEKLAIEIDAPEAHALAQPWWRAVLITRV